MKIPIQFFKPQQGNEVFIDRIEISRNTFKKIQTTNMKLNPLFRSNLNENYAFNHMEQFNLYNNFAPFGLGYPQMQINYMSINYITNINTSLNRKQKKQMKHMCLNQNYLLSNLEVILSPTCSFDKEAYKKLQNIYLIKQKSTNK